ncbi:S41 family peptidase [Maribacter sp. 2-571]|uniref:S41 family peptidase n=1 Tax=Maribacter sp. 2-571 TaxID=3417569 RepID=UPI003D351CFF
MKNSIITFLCCMVGFFFISCEEAVLGDEQSSTARINFDLLWKDFDEHYAPFDARNVDWDELYEQYSIRITSETTNEELWTISTELLENLKDRHINLVDTKNERSFKSGEAVADQAEEEFDLDLVKNKYLEAYQTFDEAGMSFGKIKDKAVGYIYLSEINGEAPGVIDKVIAELKDAEAIIVDIRNNGGGSDRFAHRVAGAFADGEHFIYTVQTKNGPGRDDFDEKKKWFAKPAGPEQFTKPVILLMDRFTLSAAEIFQLNMQAFGHVTTMGDFTGGSHSDVSSFRFLPNGWIYTLAPQLYLMPDGQSLEGIGIAPDEFVKNTKESIDMGNDLVMENAFEYLGEIYGIE